MADEIEDKVKKIIIEQLEVAPDKVKLEASFSEDLKADSLAVVELVLALEEQFKIEIPDEDTEKIKTVGDAINYNKAHAKKVAGRAGGKHRAWHEGSSSPASGSSRRSPSVWKRRGRACSPENPASVPSRTSTIRSSRRTSPARSKDSTSRAG